MAKRVRGRTKSRARKKRAGSGSRSYVWGGLALALAVGGYLGSMTLVESPVSYSSIEEHVKYGSTGSERRIGVPYAVVRALPELCEDYLPATARGAAQGYSSLGLIEERGHDLPVGFSRRRVRGMDLVGLNCGLCHVGQVQESATSEARTFVGMPANTVDLGSLDRFVRKCVSDSRFNLDNVLEVLEAEGVEIGWLERVRLQLGEFERSRERLLRLVDQLRFLQEVPEAGPGRVDTVNATKVLLSLDSGARQDREVASVDFAAIWQQGKKARMNLYWDGSNDSMQERHLLGAIHTGAVGTADIPQVMRVRNLFEAEQPPEYPFPVREERLPRGRQVYEQYCSECHGRDGRDLSGGQVGKVTPLGQIGTDSGRLDAYTETVSEAQRTLSPDGQVSFRRFKPTAGYANIPLDGLWLRAPYLHNGSVPSLRDLLEPSERRPRRFYRGSRRYDPRRVGFVSSEPEQDGRPLFDYDTTQLGNSNRGHEGERYGTELSSVDKDSLIEYLKRF